MNEDQSIHAHQHSKMHRAEILSSRVCGCFYCLRTFPPCNIREWCDPEQCDLSRTSDRGQTALCPYCGIDSVLGDLFCFPITTEFLTEMHDEWFKKTISLDDFKKRLEELAFLKEDAP